MNAIIKELKDGMQNKTAKEILDLITDDMHGDFPDKCFLSWYCVDKERDAFFIKLLNDWKGAVK